MTKTTETYRIVYPGGRRGELTVVTCFNDYDIEDYDLASTKVFYDENEAAKHAKYLAKKHNKVYNGEGRPEYLE